MTDQELKQLAKDLVKNLNGKDKRAENLPEDLHEKLIQLNEEEWKKLKKYIYETPFNGLDAFLTGFSKPFKIADERLLLLCTKFSHFTQRTIGVTNYFIAKLGIGFAAIGVIMQCINYFTKFLSYKTNAIVLFLDVCWLGIIYHRTHVCTNAEEELLSGSQVKDPRILPYISPFMRVFWLMWCIIWLPADLHTIYMATHAHILSAIDNLSFQEGLLIFYYFIAVDGLPPQMSKLKAWIKNLFHQHVLQPVEQGN